MQMEISKYQVEISKHTLRDESDTTAEDLLTMCFVQFFQLTVISVGIQYLETQSTSDNVFSIQYTLQFNWECLQWEDWVAFIEESQI